MGKYDNIATLQVEFAAEYVLHVKLNRPDSLNSFNPQMWKDITHVFETIAEDPDVRAVVVSANGRIFSAGLDIKATPFNARPVPVDPARAAYRGRRRYLSDIIGTLHTATTCGKPVIAVVHGTCVGAGLEFISACDVRYCTKDSRFTLKEVDVGIPADGGSLQRLPKIVGNDSFIREIVFSARFFSAQEALQFGVVSKICDTKDAAVDAALDLAKLIATKSPTAVSGSKEVMNFSRGRPLEDGFLYGATWSAHANLSADMAIAANAAAKKVKPTFEKL
ncbi:ClpP/crotonase [Gonapodya prolifera JEL478]|uniref:ClpP/crotonase n=1 Tax=Gonapodya prolifera (strain JEL478) TaxID=1344416 RepID=A0A139A8X5_GONPJ|nr:ClpP/crotonase [Gonapodya prolifera JEL478]|eukprot:KXS13262.1 ClpP/crotonase [Gonapodya prolifera JEL478]